MFFKPKNIPAPLLLCVAMGVLFASSSSFADAKVDGFFKESLVSGGFFEDRPDLNKASVDAKSEPQTFFISREERKLHPEKAPSNNIHLPQQVFRVRSRSIGFPNGWTSNVVGVDSYSVDVGNP